MPTAQSLIGQCLNPVLAGEPYPTISMHVLMSTKKDKNDNESPRFLLCDDKFQGSYKTRGQPENFIFALNQNYFYSPLYGTSRTDIVFPDSAKRFDLLDLSSWDNTVVANPDYPIFPYDNPEAANYNIVGPRLHYGTCWTRLYKRDQRPSNVGGNPFLNLNDVRWTESDPAIYADDPENWLVNLMPAGWCFCLPIDQPMLGEQYYEDAHKPSNPEPMIDKSSTDIKQFYIPFCTPLRTYNAAGTQVGTYDGLAFSGFFNLAATKNPTEPVFDRTYLYSIYNTLPYLNYHKQILSFELWIYLSGSGVKSPRIATVRWWTYSKGLSWQDAGPNFSPLNPLMFMRCPETLVLSITFPLLQNANNPENLPFVTRLISFAGMEVFLGS